jgi:hypothetical protein
MKLDIGEKEITLHTPDYEIDSGITPGGYLYVHVYDKDGQLVVSGGGES